MNYFTMAENDYNFLKYDYEHDRVGNIMCYASQNICERYLKHIVDTYITNKDNTHILQTHNLRNLLTYILEERPDFSINKQVVVAANGYYYNARYPGNDAIEAEKDDVDICWNAVEETRKAVVYYIEKCK